MKILKFLNEKQVEIIGTAYEGSSCVVEFPKEIKAEKVESLFKDKKNCEMLEVFQDETKESSIQGFTCLVEVKLINEVVKAVLMREANLNEQRIVIAEASAMKAANSAKQAEEISKKAKAISSDSSKLATEAKEHTNENSNLITKVNADIDYIAMMTEVNL